jgi:starch synthase
MDALRICYVISELAPFAKTGGLGDVAAALPSAMHDAGHDVRVFVPLYGTIDTAAYDFRPIEGVPPVSIAFDGRTVRFTIATATLPGSRLTAHFVHCPELYGRPAIYTSDADEPLRFVLLCRAVIETCQRLRWAPHVFHCNDWQSALLPLYLRTLYRWDGLFEPARTLLTIHNLAYQGVFSSAILPQLGVGADMFDRDDLRAGWINFLKTGIRSADRLSTVSPTYAREIQTEEGGAGLHALLRARRSDLVGILNGVDYRLWSPETDPYLPHPYSPRALEGKRLNKKHLVGRLQMRDENGVPLVGMVSRLVSQKGIDLLFDALPRALAATDLNFVILGSGERHYEDFFRRLHVSFPDRVRFYAGFSDELAHLIEGASDLFLMPSRYEPCGLSQMYSLKYGSVPVVRRVGGLADTVVPYNPTTGAGTGFLFEPYTPDALRSALGLALDRFRHRDAWRRLMRNGMAQDFSWETQAGKYVKLYRELVE